MGRSLGPPRARGGGSGSTVLVRRPRRPRPELWAAIFVGFGVLYALNERTRGVAVLLLIMGLVLAVLALLSDRS